MPRYKILIEYDGTNFAGWQKQKNAISIQEEIDKAIFKFAHEKTEIYGSGRTDAGVHAFGQVAHFDLTKKIPDHTIVSATNHHIRPHKIVILDCNQVEMEFHARFSAKQRIYKYIILNRISPPTIQKNKVWHVKEPLNISLMLHVTKLFEGKHNFTSLKTSSCQAKSYIRTIDYIRISQDGDYIIIKIAARSFIHNMVRNIVGILRMIGNEKWTEEKVMFFLYAKNPTSQKITAPACGLYLEKISF
jgi:tRNA pseudouridine38-40 synthase